MATNPVKSYTPPPIRNPIETMPSTPSGSRPASVKAVLDLRRPQMSSVMSWSPQTLPCHPISPTSTNRGVLGLPQQIQMIMPHSLLPSPRYHLILIWIHSPVNSQGPRRRLFFCQPRGVSKIVIPPPRTIPNTFLSSCKQDLSSEPFSSTSYLWIHFYPQNILA